MQTIGGRGEGRSDELNADICRGSRQHFRYMSIVKYSRTFPETARVLAPKSSLPYPRQEAFYEREYTLKDSIHLLLIPEESYDGRMELCDGAFVVDLDNAASTSLDRRQYDTGHTTTRPCQSIAHHLH